MATHRAPLIITLATIAFFYAPLLVTGVNSFNDSNTTAAVWKGFTLRHYTALFASDHERARDMRRAVANTLLIGLAATVASTVLGTGAAVALHRFHGRLQRAHRALVHIPLMIPDLLLGIGLLFFFMRAKAWLGMDEILGLGTIIVAHTTFCVSYVAMTVLARLQDFDWTLIEAARDLGADTFTAGRKVLFPLLAPGIMAGALLAFTLSIDDYVVTFFVKGLGDSKTLPIHVETALQRPGSSLSPVSTVGMVNALSMSILAVSFVLTWLSFRLNGGRGTAVGR